MNEYKGYPLYESFVLIIDTVLDWSFFHFIYQWKDCGGKYQLPASIKVDDLHFDLGCSHVCIQIFYFPFLYSFCFSLPLILPKTFVKVFVFQNTFVIYSQT
jgi:hypothetical protein